MIKFIILNIIFFFAITFVVKPDDGHPKKHYFGFLFGPSYVLNNTNIPIYYSSDECGNYNNGSEVSYHLGLFYSYQKPIPNIDFDIRFIFDKRPVTLYEETSGFEVFNPASNSYQPLVMGHDYSGNLEYVIIDLGIKYQPIIDVPAYIRLSADFGNPIFSAKYDNSESIISPNNYLFPDLTRKHSVSNGKINNTGTAIGVSLGLSYKHQLKNDMIIEPGISFRKSINSAISVSDWYQNIFRLSLSIGFETNLDKTIPERVSPIIQIKNEEPIITQKETFIEPKYSLEVTDLYLKELIVTQTYPILPYIFFDFGKAELNNKYTENFSKFSENEIPNDNLQIYYNLLNIIGSRMLKNKSSTLRINGTQDSKEIQEYPDFNLAKQRAEHVANYLHEKWMIDKKRLVTSYIKKPTLPTSENYDEGFEENRRVEINSDDYQLLEPVINSKFSEFSNLTSNIYLDIKPDIQLKSFELKSLKNNNLINTITKDEDIPQSIVFGDAFGKSNLNPNDKLALELNFSDNKGNKSRIDKLLRFITQKESFETGRLNLIVFDFDKSELSNFNKLMIQNFVKNEVKQNSKIKITGSTDKLGEENYNLTLSEQRAINVSNYLKSIIPDINIIESKGVGFVDGKINNNTPEGRFYSRTVLIEVETPLE
ncbi:hypothetical protein MASR1M45_06950 [Candidatus Kapaibacterium sp.]